ncbi:MAG: DinB family protein, partial [Thermodesulfobacteriota bacterium]
VCSRIPDNERKKDIGAIFKSIHGTLNHIYYGGTAWLDLTAAQERIDLELIEWAETSTGEYLDSEYEYISNVDGIAGKLPRRILAAHMFNHQTHHRGQLTTLVMQLGIDPGITDIPWLPSLQNYMKR